MKQTNLIIIFLMACLLFSCNKPPSQNEIEKEEQWVREEAANKKRLDEGPFVSSRNKLSEYEEFIQISIPNKELGGDPYFDEYCFVFKDYNLKAISMTCQNEVIVEDDIYYNDVDIDDIWGNSR